MTVEPRRWVTVALGAWTLLNAQPSEAEMAPSPSSDHEGDLSAADHYVELHHDTLTVDTTWVLSADIRSGHPVPLAPTLPRGIIVESDRMVAVLDERGEVVALQPIRGLLAHERVSLRVSLPRDQGMQLATLPLPTPRARAIQRVRFAPGARFEVGSATPLSAATGIQVGRGISRRARRRVDVALDGPHAHRRLGALYVLSDHNGLEGRLVSATERHAGLTLLAAALFVLSGAGLYALYKRAQRVVERERVDAYLASQVAPDEAREWGILTSPANHHDNDHGGTTTMSRTST